MSNHHLATRDEILATRTGSLDYYSATSDRAASYMVLGPVPGRDDAFYAVGRRHDNLVLVTRTGTANVRGKGAQVRTRISFAQDTNDAAGTLAFDTPASIASLMGYDGNGGHVGGVAPRVLFG